MRIANLVTGSCCVLLGVVVMVDAYRLGPWIAPDGPQSGFFPFWLALIMIVTCGLIMMQNLWRPLRESFVTREQLGPVLKVLWPATAMVVLTQFIGLYVASALYLGFYMRWVGRHSWPTVVVLSVGLPVAIFFVFEQWFLVPMPKGPLEQWLGY